MNSGRAGEAPGSPRVVPGPPRVVLVTGGAGAIGTAVRRAFQAAGDVAIGLDRHEGEGVVRCDVTDEVGVAAAVAAIVDHHGPPTVLVNNAGMTGAGTVLDEPPDRWRAVLETNLTSAYLCSRAVLPHMIAAGGGAIVNVASVNGRFGGSALSGPAYAASKGGLLTLTRFLAREHAAHGVRANAVAPGPHDTPMWHALDPELRTRILGMIPGGTGPGDPADLAAAIVFLASAEARYVNGATLDVNGGQWMG